jgi:2-methylisocitrate lyase-like PEP mutase family enzyme
MSQSTEAKRAKFRALHEDGCFVLPNPWYVGSARMLEYMGFEALASTSTGFAWATGHADYTPPLFGTARPLPKWCARSRPSR